MQPSPPSRAPARSGGERLRPTAPVAQRGLQREPVPEEGLPHRPRRRQRSRHGLVREVDHRLGDHAERRWATSAAPVSSPGAEGGQGSATTSPSRSRRTSCRCINLRSISNDAADTAAGVQHPRGLQRVADHQRRPQVPRQPRRREDQLLRGEPGARLAGPPVGEAQLRQERPERPLRVRRGHEPDPPELHRSRRAPRSTLVTDSFLVDTVNNEWEFTLNMTVPIAYSSTNAATCAAAFGSECNEFIQLGRQNVTLQLRTVFVRPSSTTVDGTYIPLPDRREGSHPAQVRRVPDDRAVPRPDHGLARAPSSSSGASTPTRTSSTTSRRGCPTSYQQFFIDTLVAPDQRRGLLEDGRHGSAQDAELQRSQHLR